MDNATQLIAMACVLLMHGMVRSTSSEAAARLLSTTPEIDYDKPCGDSFQCKTVEANCIEGMCQCDETHHHYSNDNNDSCIIRSTPGKLTYFVFTTGFQLSWTIPDDYTIDIKVFDIDYNTYNCTDTLPNVCLVTGSTVKSGTKYFIVYKTIDGDEVESLESHISLCTAPEKPPEPSAWIRWKNNVTLRWANGNQHNCQYHTVVINPPPTEGNSTKTIPENTPLQELTFDNLVSGTLYTVTITAVAGNKSDNITSGKYTRPAKISGAKVLERTDSTLDISVKYIGENREKIEYRVYIDTPVTSPSSCKSDGSTDITTSVQCASTSNFTVTGLQDGTLHNLNIYTWLEGLQSEAGYNIQNYTRPKGPTITSFENITSTGFTVLFSGNDGRFDSFTLKLCLDTETTCPEVMKTNDTSYIASNLTAGTKYTVIVNTIIDNGLASLLPYNGSSFTRPNKLSSITIPDNTLHETNATIVIQEIDDLYDHVIIELYSGDVSNTARLATYKTTNITGLTPGTNYRVEVFTATITGLRSRDSVTKGFYTRPKTPDTGRPIGRGLDYITFTLQDNTGYFDHFDITDEDGKLIQTVASGGDRTFTATNLVAGTLYEFRVFTNYSNFRSDGYFRIATYTQPGAISNIAMTQVTISTMGVEWTAPSVGMVTAYQSTIFCIGPNDNSQVKTFYTTSSDLIVGTTGLEPGSVCNATVTTQINDTNEIIFGQTATDTFVNRTTEIGPQEVQDVSQSNTTSRSITIEWERPSVRNGIITGYVINVFLNSSSVHTQTLNCAPCSMTTTDNDLRIIAKTCANASVCERAVSDKRFRYNITDLHPFRTYEVSVVAKTSIDGSSKTVSYNTHESVPDGSPSIMNYLPAATTIDLTWTPPTYGERKGIITKYNISYTFRDKTCSEDVGVDVTHHILLQDNSTTRTLTGLDPYTDHDVRIQAFTSIGEGPFSKAVKISTKQSKPGEVRQLNVSATTNESISLSWVKPCRPNGEINNYKIYLTNTDTQEMTSMFSTDMHVDIQDGILPYSNYSIYVAGNTITGEGNKTNGIQVTTDVGVPKTPQNVGAKNVSSTSVNMTWITPELYTGPTSYTIVVTDNVTMSLPIPPVYIAGFEAQMATIGNLKTYWLYSVKVIAETKVGKAESTSIVIRTDEDASECITPLIKICKTALTKRKTLIEGVTEAHHTVSTSENEYVIKNVEPGQYTVKVSASTSKGYGQYNSRSATLKAGAPIKVDESPSNPLIRPASVAVTDYDTQIAIELPLTSFLCTTSNGQPNEWGVIVSEHSSAKDEPFFGTKADFEKRKNTTYMRWVEAKGKNPIPAYIATKPGVYDPCTDHRKKRSAWTPSGGVFTVGIDGKCSGVTGYCNGELPPGRSFRVKAYVCTSGGCTETMYSQPIWTVRPEAPDQTILQNVISAVVSSAVIVVVIIAVVLLKIKQLACFKKDAGNTSKHETEDRIEFDSIESEKRRSITSGQIKLVDFSERVEVMHKYSDLIFADEFKLLREKSPNHPITAAEARCNRLKNRYTNMLPFDHSRVQLRPLFEVDGSDYINANYIPGYTSRRDYIATQGPMHETVNDFWRMVWEQNVHTIVMLTKLVDNGRNKCDKYWPHLSDTVSYGYLLVTVLSESNYRDYTIRIIEVKLKHVSKKVQQFCYLKWPDIGCPETPKRFLEFIKTVKNYIKRENFDQSSEPTVVHCSAGVGSTGTFIAVDTLLQHITDHDEVDIFDLVLRMRHHRLNMVQTEEQYVFIHECIKSFITRNEDVSGDKGNATFYFGLDYPMFEGAKGINFRKKD